jgi:hypothetical protein
MYLKIEIHIIQRMPIRKEIIYPVLLECCEFAPDKFWKNIFEDLAYGKTPYGTYISKNFLCCSYKDKGFSYKIERKNPRQLFKDIYDLLTKKLGILSFKERQNKRINFHKTEERIKKFRQDWGNIRKKSIKDLLIERFVVDMKIKHSLPIKKAKQLLSMIFIAIVFKVITTKDIHYSDGKIKYIDGIEFSTKNFKITRDIYDVDITSPVETIETPKKDLKILWERYLTSLRKK